MRSLVIERPKTGVDLRRRFLTACLPFVTGSPLWAMTSTRRVACLDWALAETMIALGQAPIAVVAAADWARFVVDPPLPVETADLGLQQEINFELLARLNPDLVLISPFLQRLQPQIERIAPTLNLSVYEDTGEPLARRREVTQDLAKALGTEDAAERYLTRIDATFDDLAKRAADLPPRPILLVTFVDARHVRVYGSGSLFHNVLARLGMQNAWTRPVGFFGFDMVGIETLAGLGNAHLVTFDPVPPGVIPRLSQSPLWSRLDFVQANRVTVLPPVLMFGGLPAAERFGQLLVDRIEAGTT